MDIMKLPVVLIVLSVALNHLEATIESHQMEKRTCNTATSTTRRLANFLVHSSMMHSSMKLDAVFSPTNVGSNTYGKGNTVEILKREPLNYLPL
nr:LOW QUALITY PROTEIN: islet amyloid polypeptide [Camelus dromedarius]